jgi:maleylacetoacetate isomerase/maleylpyruvate isomerase
MKLYGYWRSSAAYRVRIALHLKEIEFESISVHLVNNGGEQHDESYVALNPNHLVPTLVHGDVVLNQSLAIIEYLDSCYPQGALYPSDPVKRAKIQALALDIACEIHPVNNLRVQQYLSNELQISDSDKLRWTTHWMTKGFTAVEKVLSKTSGEYCFSNSLTIADLCLIPQVYNANRFNIDMSSYPNIQRIVKNCNALACFDRALPENQHDAQ